MEIEILKKEEFEIFLPKAINKILFIGGSDTGKTTLIKNIANFLFENRKNVYIFDCDIGQSHVGPPTTIGYAKLKEKIENFYLTPEKFYFVGSVTPSNCIIEFLTGISRMNSYISKEKGKFLVDTTGYIKDRFAVSLKIHKIEILRPDFVILLEKENELSDIIRFLKNGAFNYKRIKIENLPSKSLEERAEYRKVKFSEYFQNLKEIELNLNDISIKIVNFKNTVDFLNVNLKDCICSLKNEYFEDISLGIIKTNEKEKIKILIPEKIAKEEIKGITISNFLIDKTILQ